MQNNDDDGEEEDDDNNNDNNNDSLGWCGHERLRTEQSVRKVCQAVRLLSAHSLPFLPFHQDHAC